MTNTLKVIESAQLIRAWCKNNLPVRESIVAYDLIILLAIKFAKKETVTVKQIFVLLPHSYTAVRHHYLQLIKDEWIECIGDDKDRRIKRIIPTQKFDEIIKEYAEVLVSNISPLASQ